MKFDQRKMNEGFLNQIIYWEGQIIGAYNDYKSRQRICELEIKKNYEMIAHSKRREFLQKQGLKWSYPADDDLCREESEKELQRWKKLAPGDKIREHRERISLQEKEEEDWEPMTDIAVDHQIEEEFEKELECLKKQEKERQEKERERKEVRQMRYNIN